MTAKQLKEAGVALEKIEESVKQIYVEKTGMKAEDVAEMLSHETYMTALEAVAKGFADEVDVTQKVTNSFEDNVVMLGGMPVQKNFFDNAPEDFLNNTFSSSFSSKSITSFIPSLFTIAGTDI